MNHDEMKPEIEEIEVDNTIQGKVNHPLNPEFLKATIHNRNTKILNVTVHSYDPVNVAKAVEELDQEELLFFFKAVHSDDSAEVFTYLEQETKEKVISAFTSQELHELVDNMSTDDLVDFVDDLPANLISKVLKATDPEDRARVSAYLNFKEDSAGTLMTPEYLQVKNTETVKAAIEKIRRLGQDMETIWEIFVVDNTRKLVGTITLDKLLEADEDTPLEDVMQNDFVSVTVNTDQEVVLKGFRKYDVSVIPVTNNQQRMLGIITFDDAMDVASDEVTEDSQISSAVIPNDEPYLKTKIWKLVRNYAVWLVVLLILNTFTSMTMSYLETPLQLCFPLLIAFLPSIMGTNGNASDQTATVTVRELGLGNITTKNYYKAAFKELKASLITGLILCAFAFGWMLVELYTGMVTLTATDNKVLIDYFGGNQTSMYLIVSLVVALTFLITIVIAKMIGITLPVLAKLVHLDPAVMSQPIISTILDILSIVVYFLLSNLFFMQVLHAA
jgi:magnesium transporter